MVAGRLVVTASAPVVGTAVVAAGTAVLVTGAAVVAAAVGTAVVVVVAAMLVTGAAVGSAGAGAGARQLRKVLGWMMTATSRTRSEVDMHNVPRQVALGSGLAAYVVLSELNSGQVWCCQSLLLKGGLKGKQCKYCALMRTEEHTQAAECLTWHCGVAEAHRAQSSGAAAAQGCCNVLGVAGQHLGQRVGVLSALCLHVERDCHGRAGAGNPGQGGQGCRSRSRGPC